MTDGGDGQAGGALLPATNAVDRERPYLLLVELQVEAPSHVRRAIVKDLESGGLHGRSTAELKKGLNQRHLTMIAMGGVIGAGLFVGSGVVIDEAGPGAFLSYAITGVVIILVMRMLGEMATANPSTGSFADYARKALGGWAGFSVGLALLVLLGDRRRFRGRRRREGHPVLGPDAAAVGCSR